MTNIGCKRFRGVAISHGDSDVLVAQLRCKMWDCDYCAERNALQWRAAILDYINRSAQYSQWSFWTITAPSWAHNGTSVERYKKTAGVYKQNWSNLMKRCRRQYGKFEYVRVLESHKSGALHAHVLASVWLDDVQHVTRQDGSEYRYSKWLLSASTNCGFGYICDHRNLGNDQQDDSSQWHAGGVAGYVTKYVTKDLSEHDAARKEVNIRKIQTSRGIKKINIENERDWTLAGGIYRRDVIGADKPYIDVTTGKTINSDDFLDTEVYPPDKESWFKFDKPND